MNIRDRIKMESQGYSLYNVRINKYKQDSNDIPFLVSPSPFKLTDKQIEELKNIGYLICAYMETVTELYNNNEEAKLILDRGKPELYLNKLDPKYLFLRPDLILTENGFIVCEIEISPFGLALAEILNNAYGQENFDTIIHQNKLKNYVSSKIPKEGTIAYSSNTEAFSGQIDFMADKIFSGDDKKWISQIINGQDIKSEEIYRAFYLSEYINDKNVHKLLEQSKSYMPSLTPQFEEKAILSFIWDKRFIGFFKSRLGNSNYEYLRKIIPPTWILGEEENFDLGMPKGIITPLSIAGFKKSNRKIVLKQSGFSNNSSWSQGVEFLHKLSNKVAEEKLKVAMDDEEHLYILQDFKEGKRQIMKYINQDGNISEMNVKIRITPYYSFMGTNKGELIAAKVTGCENTDYIHASTASINTAIAKGGGNER